MGTRLMTPDAARRVARAHPGSGFARRSARASHSNSEHDAQAQAAGDKGDRAQNREGGAASGHKTTQADQSPASSAGSGQEQAARKDQCLYCTPETLCARHANRWAWQLGGAC
ncbi:hypothetical protein DSL72_001600 [Monilinia vaccinii-corymbosi]|uniref:Uncharacterized protein n=1 Tax=Monilinia vaccinii-corymbosi TaxID=61207 RepID=A0A8A3P7Y7_9HELO|nr:hypothetical protein DSL72_001600 [Monilinia vaccinii-corymbosi]